MRAQVTPALASVTTGQIIPVDREANPFSLGLQVVVSGTNTSKVQFTLDNVFDSTVTPTWIDMAAPFAAISATTGGNFVTPCTAIRLNMTAFTSGTAQLTVLQSKPGS